MRGYQAGDPLPCGRGGVCDYAGRVLAGIAFPAPRHCELLAQNDGTGDSATDASRLRIAGYGLYMSNFVLQAGGPGEHDQKRE